jgi:major vault protein
MSQRGQGDLVLNPNQYAFVLVGSKGTIEVYVGPVATALNANDKVVVYDPSTEEFVNSTIERGVQRFVIADEGSYIVLNNPNVAQGGKEHPESGKASTLPDLDYGRTIVVAGPARFPLWPGQKAEVVSGHQLRSDQYLIARVYNEDEAQKNWSTAVVKTQSAAPEATLATDPVSEPEGLESGGGAEDVDHPFEVEPGEAEAFKDVTLNELDAKDLVLGQLIVISGSEVSFYIPPTGIEIVKGDDGKFIRDAVTLERLEYCLLLDESGNKRYVVGPAVVFPRPTEHFVIDASRNKKFRALELNDDMGIYIKVIAEYTEGSKTIPVGDELFITGKDQRIYFPREEHSIIRYGDKSVHFAVAIPTGEGRYVLDKNTGGVDLVRGPKMFLADPRKQVNVRRVLDDRTVGLYYPGNQEALAYNRRLLGMIGGRSDRFLAEDELEGPQYRGMAMAGQAEFGHTPKDEFERSSQFTPPRTITLDTKYEGAVGIDVWTGYAVNVVSKSKERRVVVGPASILLEYDEWLEAIELSTGRPKKRDRTLRTVFLRVKNNTVSDEVTVMTKDLVEVTIEVSYRVNFEGVPEKWFEVEDYVGHLTEHARSLLANEVKNHGIEQFMAKSADIVRDTILGKSESGNRTGGHFDENGMVVYDVEVLRVEIGDNNIADMLTEAQSETVSQALQLASRQRAVENTVTIEQLRQQELRAQAGTAKLQIGLDISKAKLKAQEAQLQAAADRALQILKDSVAEAAQDARITRDTKDLAIRSTQDEHELAVSQKKNDLEVERLEAVISAEISRIEAVSPELANAITLMGTQNFAVQLAQAIGPLSAIHQEGIDETFLQLFSRVPALSPLFTGVGEKVAGSLFEQQPPSDGGQVAEE